MKYYVAIDIGASSGRHIVGWKENNEIKLDEVYRFPNGMKQSADGLVWDTDEIFFHIKHGLKKAFDKYGSIHSVAIDTWGVDYVLMHENKPVLPCFAYRNDRTTQAIRQVHAIVSFEQLYAKTGIQFQAFNTVYQLYADKLAGRLDGVTDYLMMPEFFSYLLTGVKKHEYTDATTGGTVNVVTGRHDEEIIKRLDLPKCIFKPLNMPQTVVGVLKDDISHEVGGQTTVVLCASHDTASAYEAVDCDERSVVLSSGTWSLIGAKLKTADTSAQSCATNFSNEGGVGYTRYLKNIMGMWIINQVQKSKGVSFAEIVSQAEQSTYRYTFDVNDDSLMSPSDMEEAVKALLVENPPQNDGDLYASIFRSLAVCYKNAVCQMESNLGRTFDKLYIVGGGAKNNFLNKLTQEYTGKQVIALPIEATAIGNLKSQMTR